MRCGDSVCQKPILSRLPHTQQLSSTFTAHTQSHTLSSPSPPFLVPHIMNVSTTDGVEQSSAVQCSIEWGRDPRQVYPQQPDLATVSPEDLEVSSMVNCSAIVGCTPTVSSRSCQE